MVDQIKVGDMVQFNASRIMHGNPVEGIVKEIGMEWIEIELTKYIEGISNSWDAGEVKSFRLSLIIGSIKILNAPHP